MPFTSYNTPSTNNYTYYWSPAGETNSTIAVQPTSTTTYTVDVTSGTTTCQSDVTISVNPSPTVDLGSDVTICSGITQTLDAGLHSSYLWSTGETTGTIDVNTSGTYRVTVQDAIGCDASDIINITVFQH